MKVLVLNSVEVRLLLPMRECIEVMAEAFAALARGQVQQPLRTVLRPPEAAGLLGLMPAYRSGERARYALKSICVFPGNRERGLDAHQGLVTLFSASTGEPRAVLNASAITALRTAAVSALATRLLARPEAGELALVGAGVQARAHLEALACVRPLRRVRIASQGGENARRLAAELGPCYPFALEAVASVEEAVRGADLVVTVTSSTEPVLRRAWLAPGAHVNAVGAVQPHAREIDTETMQTASIFVDSRAAALRESGDYWIPAREQALGPEHIRAELGELVLGRHAGRRATQEITLFKSLGLAVEDLAAAEHVYRRAREASVGTWVELG